MPDFFTGKIRANIYKGLELLTALSILMTVVDIAAGESQEDVSHFITQCGVFTFEKDYARELFGIGRGNHLPEVVDISNSPLANSLCQ